MKKVLSFLLVITMVLSLCTVNTFAYTYPKPSIVVFTQNFNNVASYDNVIIGATGVYGDKKWAYDNRNGRGSGSLADTADGGKEVKIESRGDAQANFIVYLPSTIFEAGKKYKAEIQVRPDLFITNAATLATDISFTTGANRSAVDISGTAKTYNVANGTATTIETNFFEYDASFTGSVINVRLDLDVNMSQQTAVVNGATKKNEFVYFDNLVIYQEGTGNIVSTSSIFANKNFDFESYPDGIEFDATDAAWSGDGITNTSGDAYASINTDTTNTFGGSGKSLHLGVGGGHYVTLKDFFNGTTDNGKTYTINMKMYPRDDNVNAYVQIGVLNDDSKLQTQNQNGTAWFASGATLTTTGSGLTDKEIVLTPNTWNDVSFNITPGTSKYLVFEGFSNKTRFFIDDVTIIERTSMFNNKNFNFDSMSDDYVFDSVDATVNGLDPSGNIELSSAVKYGSTGKSLYIQHDTNDIVLNKVFNPSVDEGKKYKFSVKIRPDATITNATGLKIGIKDGSSWEGTPGTILAPNANEWNDVSFTLTGSSTIENLTIASNTACNFYIDDVTYETVLFSDDMNEWADVDATPNTDITVGGNAITFAPSTGIADEEMEMIIPSYAENGIIISATVENVTDNGGDNPGTITAYDGNGNLIGFVPITSNGTHKLVLNTPSSHSGKIVLRVKAGDNGFKITHFESVDSNETFSTVTSLVNNEITVNAPYYVEDNDSVNWKIKVIDQGKEIKDFPDCFDSAFTDDAVVSAGKISFTGYLDGVTVKQFQPVVYSEDSDNKVFFLFDKYNYVKSSFEERFKQDFENSREGTGSETTTNLDYTETKHFRRTWGGTATVEDTGSDKHLTHYASGSSAARTAIFIPNDLFEDGATYRVKMDLSYTGTEAAGSIPARIGFMSGTDNMFNLKNITINYSDGEATFESNDFVYSKSTYGSQKVNAYIYFAAGITNENKYVTIDNVTLEKKVIPQNIAMYFPENLDESYAGDDDVNTSSFKDNDTNTDGFTVASDRISAEAHGGTLSMMFPSTSENGVTLEFDVENVVPGGTTPSTIAVASGSTMLGYTHIKENGPHRLVFNTPSGNPSPITIMISAGDYAFDITSIDVIDVSGKIIADASISGRNLTLKLQSDAIYNNINTPELDEYKVVAMDRYSLTPTGDESEAFSHAYPLGSTVSLDALTESMNTARKYKDKVSPVLYDGKYYTYIPSNIVLDYVNDGFDEKIIAEIKDTASSDSDVATILNKQSTDSPYTKYDKILGLLDMAAYTGAVNKNSINREIYLYKDEIYNNRSYLTYAVYGGVLFDKVKAGTSANDIISFIQTNEANLLLAIYSNLHELVSYSPAYFNTNILTPVKALIDGGQITNYADMMAKINELMETNTPDIDNVVFYRPFSDDERFEERIDHERTGSEPKRVPASDVVAGYSGNAPIPEFVDHTTGTTDGNVVYIKKSGYPTAFKFNDVFNKNGITPKDLGSTYNISFWAYLPGTESKTIDVSISSPRGFLSGGKLFGAGNVGGYYNPYDSKYYTHTYDWTQSSYLTLRGNQQVTLVPGVWQKVEFTYTHDTAEKQTLLLSQLCISINSTDTAPAYFYIDDIKTIRVTDNRPAYVGASKSDLQPLSAGTRSNVTVSGGDYVFSNGGTIKFAMTESDYGKRFVTRPGEVYQIDMVVKTTSDNALSLTANGITVDKHSVDDTANNYILNTVDDYEIVVGDISEATMVCDGILATSGTKMVNTGGEFKNVKIIFKETGTPLQKKYQDLTMDTLRAINITATGDGSEIRSMKISKYNADAPVNNGDFASGSSFESWGGDFVDTSVFSDAGNQLTVTNGTSNAGKSIEQTTLVPAGEIIQIGFTNVDNGAGDASIEVYDLEGNLLGKTQIAPATSTNEEKVVVFKSPAQDSEFEVDATTPVIIKVVAGTIGTNTVDNIRVLSEGDVDYVDLTPYTPYTDYFTASTTPETFRQTVINDVCTNGTAQTSDDILRELSDAVVKNRFSQTGGNYTAIFDILNDNAAYLGLTNWSYAADYVANYPTMSTSVKETIATYAVNSLFTTTLTDANFNRRLLPTESDTFIPAVPGNLGDNNGGGSSGSVGGSMPNISGSGNVTPSIPTGFVDLDQADWAKSYIVSLASKGIISGYEDNTFRPNNVISRAEVAKLLAVGFNVYNPNAKCNFSDVSSNDWYYSYVATLENLGVTKGMGDGLYGANSSITRQDLVVLIVRMSEICGRPIGAITTEASYNDSHDISNYATEAIKILQRAGIVSGFEDGTFRPNETATRAQVAKILDALIN